MGVAVSVWPIRSGQFGVGKNGSGSNWEWPQLVVNILAWSNIVEHVRALQVWAVMGTSWCVGGIESED